MSEFQCDLCGCLENTALTNAPPILMKFLFVGEEYSVYRDNWREILGLNKNDELGGYCSACSPIWYDANGHLGIGPNLYPKPGAGLWHGRFLRIYLPKGEFETAPNGNLRHKRTLDEHIMKYAINNLPHSS